MARQKSLTAEQRRYRRANIQAASQARSQARRCPQCARLSAIVRVKDASGVVCAVVCRFCKHESSVDHYEGAPQS